MFSNNPVPRLVTVRERFPAVSFGTSGVRSLVTDMTPEAISAYVFAFMQQMHHSHTYPQGGRVAVGIDLRPSSPDIAAVVCSTLNFLGYQTDYLGPLPTPALALWCLSSSTPGMMITGSHIPFDRNGIKFYTPIGEILKEDEQNILNCPVPTELLETLFSGHTLPEPNTAAASAYVERIVARFGDQCLKGWRVGLYEHSAVGRDLTKAVLQDLGAVVIPLGRSDDFVPIDTEAVSEQDSQQAIYWCNEYQLDALISTDGDGDRPLMFDAYGQFIRGDILGLLCASHLNLTALAVPVSCNTAIEKFGTFKRVERTRIGSPYVVEAMNMLREQGESALGGFEANGGFLLGTSLPGLPALPTRDALLPIVAVLSLAASQGVALNSLIEGLPPRFTYSDRIKDVPVEDSRMLLTRLLNEPDYREALIPHESAHVSIDVTDGARLTYENGDIIHIRPSGNAPELRCYTEAGSVDAAKSLCVATLASIL